MLGRYEGDKKENNKLHQPKVECTQGASWTSMKNTPSAQKIAWNARIVKDEWKGILMRAHQNKDS